MNTHPNSLKSILSSPWAFFGLALGWSLAVLDNTDRTGHKLRDSLGPCSRTAWPAWAYVCGAHEPLRRTGQSDQA